MITADALRANVRNAQDKSLTKLCSTIEQQLIDLSIKGIEETYVCCSKRLVDEYLGLHSILIEYPNQDECFDYIKTLLGKTFEYKIESCEFWGDNKVLYISWALTDE